MYINIFKGKLSQFSLTSFPFLLGVYLLMQGPLLLLSDHQIQTGINTTRSVWSQSCHQAGWWSVYCDLYVFGASQSSQVQGIHVWFLPEATLCCTIVNKHYVPLSWAPLLNSFSVWIKPQATLNRDRTPTYYFQTVTVYFCLCARTACSYPHPFLGKVYFSLDL